MAVTGSGIFSKIKHHLKLHQDLLTDLSKHPYNWPKFQKMFNSTLEEIYQDILQFERSNISQFESQVYKIKKIFEKRYRPYFLYGDYIKWCLKKPLGYAGDFKIIDDIYQNQPRTNGFDRLLDNWVMQLAVCKSVRERKEDFKKIIYEFISKNRQKKLRIMNLGSGPAREIKELLAVSINKLFLNVIFDCYDFDIHAIEYAKKLLDNTTNVNFFQKNVIRLALKRNIEEEIPYKYDLIYSTGLFDYLDEKIAIRLVSNLKNLIKQNGIIIVSNAEGKYNNSSAIWMEWIGEWYLIYRTEDELKQIFLNAGFSSKNIQILIQSNKVMQYCLVKK